MCVLALIHFSYHVYMYVHEYYRGEAQAKAGKKEQTQGHMQKKVSDLKKQIKQTAKDTTRL